MERSVMQMQTGSRAWRAAGLAMASAAGPAGMAVGSALLAGAACALGAAIAPQAMAEGLKSPQMWPVLLAGMSSAAALMGAGAAGAAGAKKGLFSSGEDPARPAGVKEAFLDAWRTMRAHMIHGKSALGLTAAVAALSALASSPQLASSWFGASAGAPMSAAAGFLCLPLGAAAVMATLAAVCEPAERAVECAAAALGSEEGARLRAERVELALADLDEAEQNPSVARALVQRLMSRRERAAGASQPEGGSGPKL